MKQIKIQDLAPDVVKGIELQMPNSAEVYKENWFEWTATTLTAKFKSSEVVGGTLKAWKHTVTFGEIETHIDAEMFYFVSGTALMLFADIKNGKPDMVSVQIVRIRANTQIIIPEGKAHFVAVAQDDEPLYAVVIAPKMDAPRMTLPEMVEGM